MGQIRFSANLVTGIVLAVFLGIALYLRVYLPYDNVFSGDWINFTSVDAYYHMRLVDNLLYHFPQRIAFDPYTSYPNGHTIFWPPFFDWLLAGIIWLASLGSPSQHTVDVISVYFPVVLGVLTIIPVYFIGKELFNRWAGVLSAGLIILLPGFLPVSSLGFTDHHVAETLFTTVTILFLILAIKSAKQRHLTFKHLKHRDWAIIKKPLIHSLLAGISLGIYLLTWAGGLLFVFLIFVYFIVQFIIDHTRGENTDYLVVLGTLSMLIVSVISLPLLPRATWLSQLYLPSFIIATITPLVLAGISRLLRSRRIKQVYYPLALLGLGLSGLGLLYIINPSLLEAMLDRFSVFTPAGTSLTISEVQPLLLSSGNFSWSAAWANFTTNFFLSFVALGILVYLVIKRGNADINLLVVWSLFMLAATLGQRRFVYYFAVNVALLTGYLSWQILKFSVFRKMTAKPVETPKMMKRKKSTLKTLPKGAGITANHISATLGMVVVFFLVFFPNISGSVSIAKHVGSTYDDAWYEALSWLKENTPDPFGKPDIYYKLYEPPPWGEDYNYPESAYGVMSWWDYGHRITRIAHRIPVANPFQEGASESARFFTTQDEASANEIMDALDSRYVILDYATATTKFHAMATFAGSSPGDFRDIYYLPQKGKLVPKLFLHTEYYYSLSTRLYNFDGNEVAAKNPRVIRYEQKINRNGNPYKEITDSQSFSSYEEARAYVSNQKSDNYEIVGTNPFISPVPLNALEHYRLIYSSERYMMQPGIGPYPLVKIFEYVE